MISQLVWKNQLSKSDPVYSFCVSSCNSEIIAACSNDIIFIKLETGEIVDRKRFHRSTIYSVEISFDELYFASSSADGMVIIWQTKDHDSLLNFGSSTTIRSLMWNPTQDAIIALSVHEFHIWQPTQARTLCIQIKDHSISIENGSFSADGLKYAIYFSDCTVKIYQFKTQNEIESISFNSPLTIIKFRLICNDECLITTDVDRYVSVLRISDKKLIRKNKLGFEALQMTNFQNEGSNYFIFAGVSNKISIFTEDLMFLDNIQCIEKWVWDVNIDKSRHLIVCGRNGFVEKRTFCFPSSSASISNYLIYIDNLNSLQLRNLSNDQNLFSLKFPNIILSLSISYHHLLVMFKSSIEAYLYNFEINDILYKKMFEIPGNFDRAKSDISDRNIFVGCGKELTVYSMNGILKTKLNFISEINSIKKTEAVSDGCVIGCQNGSIFLFIVDQPEPICLFRHKKAVKFVKKWNLTVAFIDIDKELFVINYFTKEVIFSEKNIHSFTFSDRVENLFAFSDCKNNLFVRFLDHMSMPNFIEGEIVSFFGNDIVLLNGIDVVHCAPNIPFEKVLRESKIHENDISLQNFYELVNINPTFEQWKLIYNVSYEINIPEVQLLAAQHLKKNYFEIQSSQKVVIDQIEIEKRKTPHELEELGIIDMAIREYANLSDWDNVYRLVNSFKLESLLLDLSIPQNECELAAKYLLNSKLYDSAIKLLKKSGNLVLLAELYVSLGMWVDAVMLSASNPSIHHIIFPKFGEQLFEHENYFESLISFFIPTLIFDSEERSALFTKLYNNALTSKDSYLQMSFVCLLQAFNDPSNYWLLHQKSVALYASNRLSQFLLLPMTESDVKTVFHLSYYVIACLHRLQIRGVCLIDVLNQMLLSSTILSLKKWIEYSLTEISSFSVSSPVQQLVEAATSLGSLSSSQKVEFLCPRCKSDIFECSPVPLLNCPSCGATIAFSTHSCEPLSITTVEKNANIRKSEVTSNLNVIEKVELSEFYVIRQSLKEAASVEERVWLNERIEDIRCCCNCGALYSEADYEEAVVGKGRCVICRSSFVDDEDDEFALSEEEASIRSLLRPFEEDSPVKF